MNRSTPFTRLIDVAGQRLRVAIRPGDPGRTPLLLINGIGAGLESFQPFVDALDPQIPVVRFNVPGIGGSGLPAKPYRLSGLARLIGTLLDVLGHDHVDVLGISWGGGLAQQFAHSQRRRCRKLVLVATATGSLMVPAEPQVLAKMAAPRRYKDPAYLRSVAPDLYGGSARADPGLVERVLLAHTHVASRRAYVYQLLAMSGWTSVPFLPTLTQPTLVLAGDDDPIIPLANGRILTTLIPRARLHVYRGGHLELAARPDLLVPTIEDFLRGDHGTVHRRTSTTNDLTGRRPSTEEREQQ